MFYNHFRRAVALLPLALAATACTTVDFSQPEMALPQRFADGATIQLTSFSSAAGWGVPTEGPALSIIHDQVAYGMVRCSRPGPRLELEIDAAFTKKEGDGTGDRLIGVATWRDPASRQVVGRHHLDVPARLGGRDYTSVNVSDGSEDIGSGASVPRGQIEAGEAFVAQLCAKAFD